MVLPLSQNSYSGNPYDSQYFHNGGIMYPQVISTKAIKFGLGRYVSALFLTTAITTGLTAQTILAFYSSCSCFFLFLWNG